MEALVGAILGSSGKTGRLQSRQSKRERLFWVGVFVGHPIAGTSQKISDGCLVSYRNEYFLGKRPIFGQVGANLGYNPRLELSRFD